MPTVGSGKNTKVYPYTKEGTAAAKAEAARSGQPMEMARKKAKKKSKSGKKGY